MTQKGVWFFFFLFSCRALRCYLQQDTKCACFFSALLLLLQGTKAPGAAGVIHQDFEKGFIKACFTTLLLIYCFTTAVLLLYCYTKAPGPAGVIQQHALLIFTTDLLIYYCLLLRRLPIRTSKRASSRHISVLLLYYSVYLLYCGGDPAGL